MGKPTGFLDFSRKGSEFNEPLDRIRNFSEFHSKMDKETRCEQAARCMNCGVPFCQSGENFGGMFSGCPLHNLIPEWNDEIYHGNWKEALSRLLKTNNFPEFTGRVCPALCEAACICGMNGEAVTVHDNELSIIEEGFNRGWIKAKPPAVRSGKCVAVIGSGPAGLAAADCLNKRGHSVTIFEREKNAGGLLMYGIPNMKLDKKVVTRRVELMKQEGVEFKTGVDVGNDVKASELIENYDAVIICCGSKTPRDLEVPGREALGIYFAVDYLKQATQVITGEAISFSVNAKNKNVVIVGGGDTGNDCVATAIRQGCKSVTQLEMMPKSPDKRSEDNQWPQWPKVCKTDYGQKEAIAVFGDDPRIYKTTVKEIVCGSSGSICGIKTVELRQNNKLGKTTFEEIPSSVSMLDCELLLIAAGFKGCEDYVVDEFGLARTNRGNIQTAEKSYKIDVEKVFAAGDARRGQSLVVWAIKEGRDCAKEVDNFLMGYSNML